MPRDRAAAGELVPPAGSRHGATYSQALTMGAQVRRGERETLCAYFARIARDARGGTQVDDRDRPDLHREGATASTPRH
ncbi:ArdC-like ssDNA-binding domain-containing protein [Variovorax beijingensis]|uniref:ArdC-like ssDNA-binding domain-containing protein n=1 Tax=Variovorax beijingensis TaxID=2496117 RepID=UPI0037DC5FC9